MYGVHDSHHDTAADKASAGASVVSIDSIDSSTIAAAGSAHKYIDADDVPDHLSDISEQHHEVLDAMGEYVAHLEAQEKKKNVPPVMPEIQSPWNRKSEEIDSHPNPTESR